jgi:hypothetical protein
MNPPSDPRFGSRKDWAQQVIRASSKTGAVFMTIFAAFWNFVSWTITIAFLYDQKQKGFETLLVLLFPAIGLLLAWIAIYSWLQYRRWGVSELKLDAFPPRLGSIIRGVARASRAIDATEPVRLQLRCVHITRHRRNGKTETRRNTLWENESYVDAADPALRQGRVNVAFPIPRDQPVFSKGTIEWELMIQAKTPGPDYSVTFDLPVIEADANAPTGAWPVQPMPSPDRAPVPASAGTAVLSESAAEQVIASSEPSVLITESAGATRIEFPSMRHLGITLTFAFIGYGLLAGAVAAFVYDAPLLFPIIMTLIGGLMSLVATLSLFTSRKITVARSGIELETRFLVVQRYTMIAPDEISKIDSKMTASSGDKSYYDIQCHTTHGKVFKLGTLIRGRPATEAIIQRVNSALGR